MGVRWETVEIARTSVPLVNTFLRCENAVGTAIVLPGGRGGWMTPSVYYPVLAMLDRSLDVLALESNYKVFPEIAILSADAAAAFDVGLETGARGAIVVAGKSLGTLAMAGLLADERIPRDVLTIWLTPLLKQPQVETAIPQLERPGLFVIGTVDEHYDAARLDALRERGHQVLVIEGAHHGLAIDGNAAQSAEVAVRLVGAVSTYLDALPPARAHA